MWADSWAASARRAAGAVHRPSVTVRAAAADAFAVAAADVAALACLLAAGAAGAAVAAWAELQATTPTSSTAEPAKSARIPIAHRSISVPRVDIAPDVCARAAERPGIAISARPLLCAIMTTLAFVSDGNFLISDGYFRARDPDADMPGGRPWAPRRHKSDNREKPRRT